jgi:AP endonuclease-1
MVENGTLHGKRSARADISPPPKRAKRTTVVQKSTYVENSSGSEVEKKTPKKRQHKKSPTKAVSVVKAETTVSASVIVSGRQSSIEPKGASGTAKKAPRKRKTKEEKAIEAMPIATRSVGSKILIGAHVSAAGGKSFPS